MRLAPHSASHLHAFGSPQVHLENDLPTKQMGEVTVTRSVNTECDCEGAYVWSVTFLNLEGNIPKLTADWSMLTGAAVNMTVEVLQPSTVIGGTFTLSIRNYTTEALKWDCTHSTMARALMEIGAGTVSVNRYGPNKQLGYIWDVTFKAAHDNYDVPEMVPNGTLLTGNGAEITVHTRQNGESRLHGSFQLYFRDVGPTVPIPFNANETTMIAALEDLISVDDVWVTRSGPFADRGYTWTITFSQVRHYTTEGYVLEMQCRFFSCGGHTFCALRFAMDPVTVNLPAIVPMDSSLKPYIWRNQDEPVIKGMLTGTGAQVTVFSWTGSPEHEPFHKLARGKVGEAAGSVYILKREGERWIQGQKLRAEDTDDFDKFGDRCGSWVHDWDAWLCLTVWLLEQCVYLQRHICRRRTVGRRPGGLGNPASHMFRSERHIYAVVANARDRSHPLEC